MITKHFHGGSLLVGSHDTIPNPVEHPDTTTVADGPWSAPSTWSAGVPTAEMSALIVHRVELGSQQLTADFNQDGRVDKADLIKWANDYGENSESDANGDGKSDAADFLIWQQQAGRSAGASSAVVKNLMIGEGGSLVFDPTGETLLSVETLLASSDGMLQIGTAEQPISGTAEIVFRNGPIDTAFDPQQFTHGLVMMDHATLSVYGRPVIPFLKVAQAPKKGDTVLTFVQDPEDWQPGDELWIADTRLNEIFSYAQAERLIIESVDGVKVTLAKPLAFDHLGSGPFLPHVAHLSGNVTFRSENPDGMRGHILLTGRCDVRVHDAVFRDLGRTTVARLDNTHLGPNREVLHVGTNQIGRYTFHLHHLYGRERLLSGTPQFELVGNRFIDGRRWGVAIHDSHYGIVKDNVVLNMQSAGIVFEDASEFGNLVEHNFIGLIPGSGEGVQGRVSLGSDPLGPLIFGERDPRATQEVILWGDDSPGNPRRTLGDLGHEGAGIWGRGGSNHVVGNVIANCRLGSVFWTRFVNVIRLPKFPGADTRTDFIAGFRGRQLGHEFRGNEVYGAEMAYHWLGLAQGSEAGDQPHTEFLAVDNNAWSNGFFTVDLRYCGNIKLVGGEWRGKTGYGQAVNHSFIGTVVTDGVKLYGYKVGVEIPSTGGDVLNCRFEKSGIAIYSRLPSFTLEGKGNTFIGVIKEVVYQ